MPPPSSGGLGLLQTLALLNQSTTLPGSSPSDPMIWRRLAQAQAWADADRTYWVHDPIDGAIPTAALLDPSYIANRSKEMQGAGGSNPQPGLPPGRTRYPFGRPEPGKEQGTTQITIVDNAGNIATYTSSVETVFGSRHLVEGMVMNNQLTDFSFRPTLQGEAVANRRQAGRRPMSSMAPTIVFRRGRPGAGGWQPRRTQHSPPAQQSAAGLLGLGGNAPSGRRTAPSLQPSQWAGAGR